MKSRMLLLTGCLLAFGVISCDNKQAEEVPPVDSTNTMIDTVMPAPPTIDTVPVMHDSVVVDSSTAATETTSGNKKTAAKKTSPTSGQDGSVEATKRRNPNQTNEPIEATKRRNPNQTNEPIEATKRR